VCGLEVLAAEWPDEGIIHEVLGVPAEKHTAEERTALRMNRVNTLFERRGKVFRPSGGLTAGRNGDSDDNGTR